MRDLVRRSALAPVGRRWQILIVEDADRLTEQACNALLKAIEEPTERTVWMLCAPTVEDVLPTIRSRCRLVTLSTPPTDDVAGFLVRSDGVDAALASYAARASQGHIGRARALARDEGTRNRRREVVEIPARLTSLGACMNAAQNLGDVTKEEADLITGELDAREKADLDASYGVVERGRRPREYSPALAELERNQKTRAKRRHLDVVDRSLMDLVSVYRDAIAISAGAPGQLVNEEIRPDVEKVVRASTPELNLRRIGWIFDAREQMLEFNVPVAARAGVDDAGAQGARRGGSVRRVVAIVALLCMVWPAAGSRWPSGSAATVRRDERTARRAGRSRADAGRARAGFDEAAVEGAEALLRPGHRVVPLRGLRVARVRHRDRAARLRRPARLDHRPRAGQGPGRRPRPAAGHARGEPRRSGRSGDHHGRAGAALPRRPGARPLRRRGLRPSRSRRQQSRRLPLRRATSTPTSPPTPRPTPRRRARTLLDWVDDFGGGCAEKSGALAAHVSTVEAARDMDVVRAALGESELDYFGASYGTKLGATYAELFPAKVGRFVLDGGVDPTIDKRAEQPPAGSRVRDRPARVRRELRRERRTPASSATPSTTGSPSIRDFLDRGRRRAAARQVTAS